MDAIWFTARSNLKNIGSFVAVPIGVNPVTGMEDYRVTIDDEVFVVQHRPDKSVWLLLLHALEASVYGEDVE